MWARRVIAALLACWAALAHADIWGYIDAQGVAHFAPERVDERYALFSRSGENFDSQRDAKAVDLPRAVAVPTAPPKLLAFFDISPTYKQVKHLLRAAARDHDIDYELLQALIATESGFDTHAVSPKGAVGLMQLMPETAQRFGVQADAKTTVAKKLADPRVNIQAGSRYLQVLLKKFPGQLDLTLAAYNAGEGAVARAGQRIPNYKETQNYVATVMQLYAMLKPPVLLRTERRKAPTRVAMQLSGGAAQRGNMPTPLQSAQAELSLWNEFDR